MAAGAGDRHDALPRPAVAARRALAARIPAARPGTARRGGRARSPRVAERFHRRPGRRWRSNGAAPGTDGPTASPTSAGSWPAIEWIFVHSTASSKHISGRTPRRRRASIVLPAPGGPVISRLCPPAAAISMARRATACPRMSARSVPSSWTSLTVGTWTSVTASGWFRASMASASERTVQTSRPSTTQASGAFRGGSRMPRDAESARGHGNRQHASNAVDAAVERQLAEHHGVGDGLRLEHAFVRQQAQRDGEVERRPALRTSAGARLTVIRCSGNLKPEFLIADRTRSRLSRTVASGSPTIANPGRPNCTSTSTETG